MGLSTALGQAVLWDNGAGTGVWSNSSGSNANLNWAGDVNPSNSATVLLDDTYVSSAQTIDSRNQNKALSALYFAGQYSYFVGSTQSTTRRLTFSSSAGSSTLALQSTATSTANQTLDLDVSLGSGLSVQNNAATGAKLIVSGTVSGNGNNLSVSGVGDVTFSGGVSGVGTLTKLDGGVLTFSSSASVTNLTLSGGTVLLDATSLTATTMRVTADSILDFGTGAGSTLNLSNLIIDAGVKLTVANWTDAVDYFYATNQPTSGTLSQIVFSSNSPAGWRSLDRQVRPVPEPATYGFILLGSIVSFVVWEKRRRVRTREN